MKRQLVHLFICPVLGEYSAFTTKDNLRQYLKYWHLSDDELDILLDTGVYRHENLGVISYLCNEVNPYFEGNNYEIN